MTRNSQEQPVEWTQNLAIETTAPKSWYYCAVLVVGHYYAAIRVATSNFFRAGVVSRNEGISINIYLQHTKEKPLKKKILKFFLLDALKTEFQIRYCTRRWTKSRYFSLKSGHFFQFSKKSGWVLDILDSPLCAPGNNSRCWKAVELHFLKLLKVNCSNTACFSSLRSIFNK